MARDRHSQGQGAHVQVAGPGPAWLGRLPRPGGTGQEARVPSCDHDGQVTWAQPAAALPRRWRWISDHCRTMILLPRPYSWLQCRLTCPATGIARVQPQPALPVGLCTDPPGLRNPSGVGPSALVGFRDFAATVRGFVSEPLPTLFTK
jgi:hypothetical protein